MTAETRKESRKESREARRPEKKAARFSCLSNSYNCKQKRKMPARFADDDAPPSPPRRSAEKRQKR